MTSTDANMRANRVRLAVVLAPAVLIILVALLFQPLRQPLAYHGFHDTRALLGIPNFWNVVSNLPFAVVGALALVWLGGDTASLPPHLRRCYQALFLGVFLTGFGSSFYHWAPDNASLVWDRLPMAIGFMGLFAGMLGERLPLAPATCLTLLVVFLVFGAGSVVYWGLVDDLRFYAVAQFYPLLVIPFILWLTPAAYTRGGDWLIALAFYLGAKVLEECDGVIFALGNVLSGHSLKHVSAALGAYWLYRMLQLRRAVG